jgi:hypothetical protein
MVEEKHFTKLATSMIIFAEKADFPKYESMIEHEQKYEDQEVDAVVKDYIKKGSLILVSDSKYMRGYDYRSEEGLALFIAKSFENAREAQQGLGRVGRFGDPCKRYIKEGVNLVDTTKNVEYYGELERALD